MNSSALVIPGKALLAASAIVLLSWGISNPSRARLPVPDPVVDASASKTPGLQTAVLAGGCFWGIEAVFEHVKGVKDVVSGYAGGAASTAHYETVGSGNTGHAESVRIRFDPNVVSYGQLLKVFFSVAHDPTQLDRQGPDRGSQYRSGIFYADAAQQRVATAYIAQMTRAGTWGGKPIVTRVEPLKAFYLAESHHQDFARLNPTYPYIVYNDAPKVQHLKQDFPALYR